jgi:hypothetical protein
VYSIVWPFVYGPVGIFYLGFAFFVEVCVKNEALSLEFCILQWEFNSHSKGLACLVSRYTDVGLNHEHV